MSYVFQFWWRQEHLQPGCVERIQIEGPFLQTVRDSQTGQTKNKPSAQAAGAWMATLDLPFPKMMVGTQVVVCKPMGAPHAVLFKDSQEKKVSFIQFTPVPPTVSGQNVAAAMPYGPPRGNPGDTSMPPLASPRGMAPRSPEEAARYQDLTAAGLPVATDGYLDADAQGGTFMDLEINKELANPGTGESPRSLEPRPYDPSLMRKL